ncbi:antibiotic biosynthesis monooxygenase family protein [Phreatobacter stygius]|nr:antibiotic biosynthesis monooxygenase [Phreatobacter stygius]
MFVRIYWGKIYPGAWSSIEQKYRDLMAVETPGLLGRLVSQDVNDAESMFTITLWRDMASVQAWEASPVYAETFSAALKPFIVGSQSVSLCEVKVANIQGLLESFRPAT